MARRAVDHTSWHIGGIGEVAWIAASTRRVGQATRPTSPNTAPVRSCPRLDRVVAVYLLGGFILAGHAALVGTSGTRHDRAHPPTSSAAHRYRRTHSMQGTRSDDREIDSRRLAEGRGKMRGAVLAGVALAADSGAMCAALAEEAVELLRDWRLRGFARWMERIELAWSISVTTRRYLPCRLTLLPGNTTWTAQTERRCSPATSTSSPRAPCPRRRPHPPGSVTTTTDVQGFRQGACWSLKPRFRRADSISPVLAGPPSPGSAPTNERNTCDDGTSSPSSPGTGDQAKKYLGEWLRFRQAISQLGGRKGATSRARFAGFPVRSS